MGIKAVAVTSEAVLFSILEKEACPLLSSLITNGNSWVI